MIAQWKVLKPASIPGRSFVELYLPQAQMDFTD
jgi:hypothetical protein